MDRNPRDKAAQAEAAESDDAGLMLLQLDEATATTTQEITVTVSRDEIAGAPPRALEEKQDQRALFEAFINDSYGGLLRTIQRRFCRQQVDAEELLNDALVRVVSRLHRGDGVKSIEPIDNPFAYTIMAVQRRYADWVRKHQTEPLRDEQDFVSSEPSAEEVMVLHQAEKLRARLMTEARQCVQELPEQQRRVAELRLEGKAPAAISKALGISTKTVATHWRRAQMQIMKRVRALKASLER